MIDVGSKQNHSVPWLARKWLEMERIAPLMLSIVTVFASVQGTYGQEKKDLLDALLFHASFDGGTDAEWSGSDPRIYTATNMERNQFGEGLDPEIAEIAVGEGRFGDCLRFKKKSDKVVFYKAYPNRFHPTEKWSGTVSLWMRLDPDKDLEPGYCDPVQITSKAWNDAAFFVDFDKDLPRDFRLGVFSDLDKWNPEQAPWETIAVEDRPMVTVSSPPFRGDTWTHVVFTFDNVNPTDGSDSIAKLYLNGSLKGFIKKPMQFTWEEATSSDAGTKESSPSAIMLGLSYIGDIDEFAIFSRALTVEEVELLHKLPQGIR